MSDKGNTSNEKMLSVWALVAIGAGLAIGPGVISLPGSAIALTGRSTGVAFFVAVIVGFITVIPWFFTAGVMRTKGGDYTLIAALLGPKAGGIVLYNMMIMSIAVSLMGLSAGEYLQVFFPSVNPQVVGFIVTTFFFITNMFGVGNMSKLQNVMFIVMFVGFALFIGYGLPNLQPGSFNVFDKSMYTGGVKGFASSVLILLYGCTAAQNLIYFGLEAKDARRDIPKAMIYVTVILLILYTTVGLINANVLPVDQVANKTIAEVAKVLMPWPVFVIFMITCPFFALFTTLNTIFIASAHNYVVGAEDGWLPKCFAWKNRFGAPVVSMTVLYLITMAPQLAGMNLTEMSANTALVQYIMRFVTVAAVWQIPKKLPELWEKSTLHVPKWLFNAIMILVTLVDIAVVYTSIITLTPKIVIISLAAMAVMTFIPLWRDHKGLVHPNMDQSELE